MSRIEIVNERKALAASDMKIGDALMGVGDWDNWLIIRTKDGYILHDGKNFQYWDKINEPTGYVVNIKIIIQ